jgi:hypothetical protein
MQHRAYGNIGFMKDGMVTQFAGSFGNFYMLPLRMCPAFSSHRPYVVSFDFWAVLKIVLFALLVLPGCGGPDGASAGGGDDLALGDECFQAETSEIYLGHNADESYTRLSDGALVPFRATVEAGSDVEISLSLFGLEPQTLDVDLTISDGETVLAADSLLAAEPFCLAEGKLLFPALVLSFGSLGLIDLEDRMVDFVGIVRFEDPAEDLQTQVRVRLVGIEEEY